MPDLHTIDIAAPEPDVVVTARELLLVTDVRPQRDGYEIAGYILDFRGGATATTAWDQDRQTTKLTIDDRHDWGTDEALATDLYEQLRDSTTCEITLNDRAGVPLRWRPAMT